MRYAGRADDKGWRGTGTGSGRWEGRRDVRDGRSSMGNWEEVGVGKYDREGRNISGRVFIFFFRSLAQSVSGMAR